MRGAHVVHGATWRMPASIGNGNAFDNAFGDDGAFDEDGVFGETVSFDEDGAFGVSPAISLLITVQ